MLRPMTHPPRPTDPVLARVRERLSARIKETGIPIARLARRSGVSTGTIRRLMREDDTRDIYLGTLVALASVLLMDVWELLEPLPGERWVSGRGVQGPGVDRPVERQPDTGED